MKPRSHFNPKRRKCSVVLPPNPMKTVLWKISKFFNGCFSLAVLDEKAGRWFVKPESNTIAYLKAENANGRHILLKPNSSVEPYYMLVNDLDVNLLTRHHKTAAKIFKQGRMVVETSPGNFQVLIHALRPLDLVEKRYWLKKMCSDPGGRSQ